MKQPSASKLPLEAFGAGRKAVRALCAQLSAPPQGLEAPKRILFVSPEHDSGTTSLTALTALELSRYAHEQVALIEANCFTPAMASYLGLPPAPGIMDVIDGRAEPDEALRGSMIPGLTVLTPGTHRAPQPGELNLPEARHLFQELFQRHRHTLIDAPPMLAHPEAQGLLEHVDVAVLILRSRSTPIHAAKTAKSLIQEAGVPILGSILNRFKSDMPFGIGSRGWL